MGETSYAVVEKKYLPVHGTNLTSGLFHHRADINRRNLFDRIDPAGMGKIFAEVHDSYYAEPEFCGKYLDTAAELYRTTGDKEILEKVAVLVNSIVKYQRADGYLGTYKAGKEFDETFSVWCENFVIMGLLSYYEVTGDDRALAAARKCASYIADTYMAPGGPDIYFGLSQGIVNFAIINQMPRLYMMTGEKLYLEFARWLVDKMEASSHKLVSIPFKTPIPTHFMGSVKAIELLVCYQGILDLYRATGDETCLQACEKYWQHLRDTQIGITGCGSIAELWTYLCVTPVNITSDIRPNENCVAAGFIKFSLRLYELTGEAKYFDAVEKSLFNHIFGAQALDGSDFSYYQGLAGFKVHKKDPGMYSCCRYRGMNILAHLPKYAFSRRENEVYVNLYSPARAELDMGGRRLRLEQSTDFPKTGNIALSVSPSAETEFTLIMRKPQWSKTFKIAVNGREFAPDEKNGYIEITRRWSSGDEVRAYFPMEHTVVPATVDHRESGAVVYGPLVLAVDSRYGHSIHETELLVREQAVRTTFLEQEIEIMEKVVRPENRTDDSLAPVVRFEAPGLDRGEKKIVTLVDYASAGSFAPGVDRFKVWIPMVKEQ